MCSGGFLRLQVFGLVLFWIWPFDFPSEVQSDHRHPFVQSLIEVVEITVELFAALRRLDAQNFGASRLTLLLYPSDAACFYCFGSRKAF